MAFVRRRDEGDDAGGVARRRAYAFVARWHRVTVRLWGTMRRARWLIAAVPVVVATTAMQVSATTDSLMRRSKPLVVAYDARSGEQRWRLPADRPGHASVVAATDDRVFVELGRCLSLDRDGPIDHELVVLDARSGEVAWRRSAVSSRRSAHSTEYWEPAGLAHNTRIVPVEDTANGVVRALDRRTGRQRWRVTSDGLQVAAATRDVVVLASGPNRDPTITPAVSDFVVRVLDPSTGRTRWERKVTAHSTARHVAVGPTVVAVLSLPTFRGTGGFLETLDVRTGATIAQAPFEAPGVNVYDYAVTRDIVAVGGFTGGGPIRTVGLDVATGATRWNVDGRFVTQDPADPTVLYGSLYGTQEDPRDREGNRPRVGMLDTSTGALLWARDAPGWVIGFAHGTLVVGAGQEYEGSFSVLDALGSLAPADGEVRWDIVPGPNKSTESERHFPRTYTVSSFAGPRGAYVSGGCALTALN